jgi:hypothetical protein
LQSGGSDADEAEGEAEGEAGKMKRSDESGDGDASESSANNANEQNKEDDQDEEVDEKGEEEEQEESEDQQRAHSGARVREEVEERPTKKAKRAMMVIIPTSLNPASVLDYSPYISYTGNESQAGSKVYLVAGLQLRRLQL